MEKGEQQNETNYPGISENSYVLESRFTNRYILKSLLNVKLSKIHICLNITCFRAIVEGWNQEKKSF